jgi:hypothetical protein
MRLIYRVGRRQNSGLSSHNTESVRRGGDTRPASPRMLSTDPPVRNRRQRRLGAIEHQDRASEVAAGYYAISVKLALEDARSWPRDVCASESREGRRLRRRRRAAQPRGRGGERRIAIAAQFFTLTRHCQRRLQDEDTCWLVGSQSAAHFFECSILARSRHADSLCRCSLIREDRK